MDPIFIIGSGRSGTTIVGRCLGEHSSLLFIDEPRFINHILIPAMEDKLDQTTFSARLKVSDDGSGKEPMKFCRRMREHYSHQLDKEALNAIEAEVVELCLHFYRNLPGLNRTQRLQEVRKIVHRLSACTTNLIGGTRWLIKQPDLSEDLNTLHEIFPGARFIHIIRNPFDVLYSRIQRGFQNDFESALAVWFSRLRAIALFNKNVDCLMTISFEHLIGKTEQVLTTIAGFVGITPSQWINDACKLVTLDAANIGRGRNQFSQSQKIAVLRAWGVVDSLGGNWLSQGLTNSPDSIDG